MWLKIEAVDVLLFRDGRPFTRGENHRANSLFPPLAFTIQGFLRSLLISETGNWQQYLSNNDPKLNNMIGAPRSDSLGQLSIRGPYLARERSGRWELYFPLPTDVVMNDKAHLRVLQVSAETVTKDNSNVPAKLSILDAKPNEGEPESHYWISEAALLRDYTGQKTLVIDDDDILDQVDLFMVENRTGIGMDYSRGTANQDDGLIYSTGFVRMQPGVVLLIELPKGSPLEVLFPTDGKLITHRMGGEGRIVRVERIAEKDVWRPTPPSAPTSLSYKLVLLTPTYLEGGWRPTRNAEEFDRQFVSTALQRPLKVGGWNLALGMPRPIRKYLPPGSVYYFTRASQSDSFITTLLDQPNDGLPLAQLGFGETVILDLEG